MALSRPHGPRCVAAVLLCGALLGVPAAGADVVKTKDGKTYEGRVVSQDDATVVVDTTFDGRKELPRATVTSVDTSVPPLRDQLAFRVRDATDVPALLKAVDWARSKGFKDELADLWKKVVALEPQNAKARKALGHVKVGDRWMTPEEKAAADAAADEAAMRAKGLVLHQGRWVTPQEKDALEKGLVKDGDDWVTEEVFHRRRGERKVGDAWVRVGEGEGKARQAHLAKEVGVPLEYVWSPRADVYHELNATEGQALVDACTAVTLAFERLLKPGPDDRMEDVRVEVVVPHKAPAYARYVQLFAKEQGILQMAGRQEWASQASRLRSFWWTDPKCAVGAYLFPNTLDAVRSNVAHTLVFVLLNRYRFNYRFTSPWLSEGLAYHLEMAAVGPSSSFTIGRAGIPGGGDPQAWQDTKRWPELLRSIVLGAQDTPLPRLARSPADGLSLVDLAKAWSVIHWLAESDPTKLKAFLDLTKTQRDEPDETNFKQVYGFDMREADAKWREHVAPAPPPTPPTAPRGKKP